MDSILLRSHSGASEHEWRGYHGSTPRNQNSSHSSPNSGADQAGHHAPRRCAEGEARGRAATLLELLDIKFGQVPADVEQRVRTATTSELETWTRRIITADTLDDIFA